jgi:hypothetical protein
MIAESDCSSGVVRRNSERLGQVVVGAGVEAGNPLRDRVAGGQNQDRQVVASAAQLTAHLEAVEPGHHHVEHHGIGPFIGYRVERLDAVLRQIDRIAVEGKGPAQ